METLDLRQYDEWLALHMDELAIQYPEKTLAIYAGKVVFIGDAEVDVHRWVHQAGLQPMPLVFRVPREEDLQSIL